MASMICPRVLMSLLVLGLAGMLGGCVVDPAYPSYPAYAAGYGYAPYYGGGYVVTDGGWHDRGWRGDDWHGGRWHGGAWQRDGWNADGWNGGSGHHDGHHGGWSH